MAARRTPWRVSDRLWAEVEPLLPKVERRFRYPGRRRHDDRACLEGILYVLRYAVPWAELPRVEGWPSGQTCWRRFHEWQRAGVWQRLHEELSPEGFTVFGVALDRSPDDIRPYLERQGVTFPAVVDPEHRVAELYGIINIPTVVWIDESARIVRPPRIEHATNTFQALTGLDCEPHLAALRRWVKTGETDLSDMEVEAESTAYVISRHYGIAEAGQANFGYIDGWARGDKDRVKATATKVVTATKKVLDIIENKSEKAAA